MRYLAHPQNLTLADVMNLKPGDTFYRRHMMTALRCVVGEDFIASAFWLSDTDDSRPMNHFSVQQLIELVRDEGDIFGPRLFPDLASVEDAIRRDRHAHIDAMHALSKQETLDMLFNLWRNEDGFHPEVTRAMQDHLENLFGVRPEM